MLSVRLVTWGGVTVEQVKTYIERAGRYLLLGDGRQHSLQLLLGEVRGGQRLGDQRVGDARHPLQGVLQTGTEPEHCLQVGG